MTNDFVKNSQAFYPKDKFIIINNNYENMPNYNNFPQTQNIFYNNFNNKPFNFIGNNNIIYNNYNNNYNYNPNQNFQQYPFNNNNFNMINNMNNIFTPNNININQFGNFYQINLIII